MVFFPMNSKASRPPLITDLPLERQRETNEEGETEEKNDQDYLAKYGRPNLNKLKHEEW